jgi:transcriptional regulator with XRE-family HTH domain
MARLKQEFAQRLHELCELRGIQDLDGRQTALARQFQVSQPAARKWLSGDGLPTLEMAIRIAMWGQVNVEWLLTGRGPRSVRPGGDEIAERVYELVRRLPPGAKRQAEQLLNVLQEPDAEYRASDKPH